GGLAQALGAEDVERALSVALGLLERVLAVHHPRAGRLAQGGDVLGRVLSHSCRSPGSRWCPGRVRPLARSASPPARPPVLPRARAAARRGRGAPAAVGPPSPPAPPGRAASVGAGPASPLSHRR